MRPPKNGIASCSTCPSSITSPVLMSRAARSTVSGFIRFPEPRSSPAPHFDGHRAASAGGCHDCACAEVMPRPSTAAMVVTMNRDIGSLLLFLLKLVVDRLDGG